MGLQVIGAGFGRTGTASLRRALEILGFGPCYHMFEIRDAPWKARAWCDILHGRPPTWSEIFDGYQATVDWPGAHYAIALAEAYPDARVLLTQRDPDAWYASTHRTLYALWQAIPDWVSILPLVGSVRALIFGVIWDGTFDGRFDDRDEAIAHYRAHHDAVIAALPAERLLVYRVEEGWEPLCTFLEVPLPDVPFPHLNESRELERVVWSVRAAPWIAVGLGLAVLVGWLILGGCALS